MLLQADTSQDVFSPRTNIKLFPFSQVQYFISEINVIFFRVFDSQTYFSSCLKNKTITNPTLTLWVFSFHAKTHPEIPEIPFPWLLLHPARDHWNIGYVRAPERCIRDLDSPISKCYRLRGYVFAPRAACPRSCVRASAVCAAKTQSTARARAHPAAMPPLRPRGIRFCAARHCDAQIGHSSRF